MKLRILMLIFCIYGCKQEASNPTSLLDIVPSNATTLLRINDFQAFKSNIKNNEFLKNLKQNKKFGQLSKKIEALDYVAINGESIMILSKTSQDSLDFVLIAIDSTLSFNLEGLKNATIEEIGSTERSYSAYTINGTSIYSSSIGSSLFVGSSVPFLENCLANRNTNLLDNDLKRLYDVSNTNGNASLFINTKGNAFTIPDYSNKTKKDAITDFANWTGLDITMRQDFIHLTGISISNDSIANYVNLFKDTRPIDNTIATLVPEGATSFFTYTFDNFDTVYRNNLPYSKTTKAVDTLFTTVQELGDLEINNKRAVIIASYSSDHILEFLEGIRNGRSDYQGNEIGSLSRNTFITASFSPLIKDFNANFYSILENSFIFTEDLETLQTLIANYNSKSNIQKEPLYTTLQEHLTNESSATFISYLNSFEKLIGPSVLTDIEPKEAKKYAIAAQITADADFYHTSLILKKIKKETLKNTTAPLFTIQLDNDIATDPQFVVNHSTLGKEIVVQDIENNLYLISSDGQIVWKKQLNGRIQGQVKQVDLFKNGKLQLAFTTEDQFLILDRNGDIVSPFEISYDGGNLNELAVFDYDKNKAYRFVVSQGSRVFMYNNEGKIVNGFKYTNAELPILSAPEHFRIAKKDYLVFKLEGGALKILNRVGDTRVKVDEKINFSANQVYSYNDKFLLTDEKGLLYTIDPKGKIIKTNLNLQKDHGLDATSKTLVIINDNILTIKKKKIALDLGVYLRPKIFYLNDKIYVSATDIQNQKVYLFDSQARSIPYFPVFGNSIIDLTLATDGQALKMVVKDQDNSLIVYEIN